MQARALHALSPDGPARIPIHSLVQGGGHGAGAFGNQPRVAAPLDVRDPRLRAQIDAARATVRRLMRLPHLESAHYYLGSYFTPGVGVHYIDWHLVGRRFDAAHPAMLLIDATPGHRVRLAGLSYWVRSHGPPAGFAGGADVWHQHRGLCFVDGLLARDAVPAAAACRGNWLNGRDLWMLHVWLVPGFENDAGTFAPYDRALCPARTGPETSWC
ncbi:MAG: hypothetical protein JWL83_1234 [Actinomycetia bacterium]|nr:hypothetical protein [Actinomycetes bacterium]